MRNYLSTPEGLVHYGTAGSGDPLLLLHQTPRSMNEYADIVPILAKTKRVIAMDTLGYGNSDKPPRDFLVEDYAKSVVFLLDDLQISRISIVGHHTGAYIALEVAAAYPERVEKLVLSGIRAAFDESQRKRLAQSYSTSETKEDGSHFAAMWNFYKRTGAWPELINQIILDVMRADKADGHVALSKYPLEKRLPLVKCPTLLVYGSKDLSNWTINDGYKASSAFQMGKVALVENAGPYILNQMPKQFAKLVLDFLKNLDIRERYMRN